MDARTPLVLDPAALEALVDVLRRRGHRVLGPRVESGAIVYGDLESAAELPVGVRDVQEPARYRLEPRGDDARFGYANGPHSWKQFLFPARVRLWSARRNGDVEFSDELEAPAPLALLGVRPCELHAIEIQDRVFLGGRYTDRDYESRRTGAFLVAVECSSPAATCFCTSLGTGPGGGEGADLVLTEILEDGHRFLARAGTDAGAAVLEELPSRPATDDDLAAAAAVVEHAAGEIRRRLDPTDLRGLLQRATESPRWDDVASRCLTCANCTLVCPTCFCSSVEDTTDLAGRTAERARTWATCFAVDHSYIHGGAIRPSARSRYRQWLTHKFGTWNDQFGVSGCVGCGRCIAWCPAAIDVTEELAALRAEEEAVQ